MKQTATSTTNFYPQSIKTRNWRNYKLVASL